jgi:hypothetical protein
VIRSRPCLSMLKRRLNICCVGISVFEERLYGERAVYSRSLIDVY